MTLRCIIAIITVVVFSTVVDEALARKWTDDTGTHTVEADFLKFENGKVYLKMSDGTTTSRELKRFSEADIAFVDQKRLQGTWSAIRFKINGRDAPKSAIEAYTLKVDGEELVFSFAVKLSGKYSLDATQNPKAMDFVPTETENKGKTLKAIYSLEDGTLRICMNGSPQNLRSKMFDALQGDGRMFSMWQRAKPK